MKDKADGVERILTADAAYPTSAVETILTAGHYVRRRRWRWLPWPTELVLVEAPRVHIRDVLHHYGDGKIVATSPKAEPTVVELVIDEDGNPVRAPLRDVVRAKREGRTGLFEMRTDETTGKIVFVPNDRGPH